MEGQKLTVIKKRGKGGAAGHHGGSWKVAFADFMTAMMAFFLLMWLLSMGPQKKREELGYYFKNFSLFGASSGGSSSSISMSDKPGGPPEVSSEPAEKSGAEAEDEVEAEMEEMKAKLEQEIQARLSDVKDQIVIGKFNGGIKIDIMDKEGKPMFQVGSTELTDEAKKVLKVIADNIKNAGQRLEIEGHTDALGYSNGQTFGNWELSTARASAARIELEKAELDPALLARVSGYADTEPIIKDNPFDPRNRRISLRLLYPQPTKDKSPAPLEGVPSIAPKISPSLTPGIAPPAPAGHN